MKKFSWVVISIFLLSQLPVFALYYDPATGAYRLSPPASTTTQVSPEDEVEELLADLRAFRSDIEVLFLNTEKKDLDNELAYDEAEEDFEKALGYIEDAEDLLAELAYEDSLEYAQDAYDLFVQIEEKLEKLLEDANLTSAEARLLIRQLEERYADIDKEREDVSALDDDERDDLRDAMRDAERYLEDAWDLFFAARFNDIRPVADKIDDALDMAARLLGLPTESLVTTPGDEEAKDKQTSSEDDAEDSTTDEDEKQTSTVPRRNVSYDGPLEYLHVQLDEQESDVIGMLDERFETLKKEAEDVFADKLDSRVNVIKCLELVDADFDLKEDIITTYDDLRKQIGIYATDLHSEISALESKIENGLLTALMENISISSLQNKVDTYLVEYTNTVDMFFDLTEADALEVESLIDDSKEENKELLDQYDERRDIFANLEDEYDTFLSKSSFGSIVAGPSMQELLNFVTGLEIYYRSLLITERQEKVRAHVPVGNRQEEILQQSFDDLVKRFGREFQLEAEDLLGDLYPVESMHTLHKNMIALRAAYMSAGTPNCTAFANNPTIEVQAPKMIETMKRILDDMNAAANEVATDDGELPTDLEELRSGVLTALAENALKIVNRLVTEDRQELQRRFASEGLTWMSVPYQQSAIKRERAVRVYLQGEYIDALTKEELEVFNDKLQEAQQRIEIVFETKDPQGLTRQILVSVQNIIQEFNN